MRDILEEPWAKKITREVRALKDRRRRQNREINATWADIGDRCRKMKERLGRTKFGEWRNQRVELREREGQHAMEMSELRERKPSTYSVFSDFDLCKMKRIAAVPLNLVDRLTPDLELPIPPTNRKLPLRDMVGRQLDAALDAFEGRRSDPAKKAATSVLGEIEELKRKFPGQWQANLPEIQAEIGCPVETPGTTKEEIKEEVRALLAKATARLLAIPKAPGTYSAASKEDLIARIEEARRAALKTPAWATPRRKAPITP